MTGNSRRQAAFVVARWLATKEFPADLLPEGPDRAFVQNLVYTVVRRLRALRRALGELVAKWPKGELESLLYVGAAQVLYMDDVPDYAAVNETVEAAKACPNPSVARVVNGVLHNLVRRREDILARLAAAPLAERESFPSELVRRWVARYGEADAERLCRWFNKPAETNLAYPDRFEVLPRGKKVSDVPGYADGRFIVQDPSTQMAVNLVDPQPGERILDACAAPGGKTIRLAWRGAAVTACEVNPKRRRRLEANLARVGLSAKYAKVLVDAPCSNTGVLRRRPDARWNWSKEKLAALVALQAEILDAAAPFVAPGGSLVYSTCSLEPEENEEQVAAFLARHPDFAASGTCVSLPIESSCDGAFAALLTYQPPI